MEKKTESLALAKTKKFQENTFRSKIKRGIIFFLKDRKYFL